MTSKESRGTVGLITLQFIYETTSQNRPCFAWSNLRFFQCNRGDFSQIILEIIQLSVQISSIPKIFVANKDSKMIAFGPPHWSSQYSVENLYGVKHRNKVGSGIQETG